MAGRLVKRDRAKHRGLYADTISNLGAQLRPSDPDQASTLLKEAIEIYRNELVRSDEVESDLARSLDNLALALLRLNRLDAAEIASTESISWYRMLHAKAPETYREDLIRALSNSSSWLEAAGRSDEAVNALKEAASLGLQSFREKASEELEPLLAALSRAIARGPHGQPERFDPSGEEVSRPSEGSPPAHFARYGLALVGTFAGDQLTDDPVVAQQLCRIGLVILGELASQLPSRYASDFAVGLWVAAVGFDRIGQAEAALGHTLVSVLWWERAGSRVNGPNPRLAAVLNNLGYCLDRVERTGLAEWAYQEAAAEFGRAGGGYGVDQARVLRFLASERLRRNQAASGLESAFASATILEAVLEASPSATVAIETVRSQLTVAEARAKTGDLSGSARDMAHVIAVAGSVMAQAEPKDRAQVSSQFARLAECFEAAGDAHNAHIAGQERQRLA
jgi:tetratricopeptide (TPR) repeat protein